MPNNANYVQQSYSTPAEPSGPVLAQTAMLAMFAGVGVVEVARRRRWNQPGSEH